MKKLSLGFIAISVIALAAVAIPHVYHASPVQLGGKLLNFFEPCARPITYSIGTVDPRFRLTAAQLLAATERAETAWEKPSEKDLFSYASQGGEVKINLMYDVRQETTAKLKTLGIELKQSRTSYEEVKTKYESVRVTYLEEKNAFEEAVARFNDEQAAYNAKVESWNQKGGAPSGVYEELQAEHAALRVKAAELKASQVKLNGLVDEVNALVAGLNQLAASLNIKVEKYAAVGDALGDTFEEGEFRSDATGKSITIYQYDNETKLVRVLAHELGHVLGLGHLTEPSALMYPSNEGTNLKATSADIAALAAICPLKTGAK